MKKAAFESKGLWNCMYDRKRNIEEIAHYAFVNWKIKWLKNPLCLNESKFEFWFKEKNVFRAFEVGVLYLKVSNVIEKRLPTSFLSTALLIQIELILTATKYSPKSQIC